MAEKIRIFISSSCAPCKEIKGLFEQGRINLTGVELIDLETKEGFPYLDKMKLSKVPSAYIGTKTCKLGINKEENSIIIQCPSRKKAPKLPQRVAEPS